MVDGDTHRRVAHARVRIGNRSAVSNRYGVAIVRDLVIIAPKQRYKPKLVICVTIENQRAHAAQSPCAVVQNCGAGSF